MRSTHTDPLRLNRLKFHVSVGVCVYVKVFVPLWVCACVYATAACLCVRSYQLNSAVSRLRHMCVDSGGRAMSSHLRDWLPLVFVTRSRKTYTNLQNWMCVASIVFGVCFVYLFFKDSSEKNPIKHNKRVPVGAHILLTHRLFSFDIIK